MSDLKTTKKNVEHTNVDDSFAQPDNEEVKDESQEETTDELGTEETPQDSSPEETSGSEEDAPKEASTEEKVDELALLKEQVDKLSQENNHVKEAMQKRIDELTWQLKSQKEQSDSNKERTWDDLDAGELTEFIARYTEEGNGKMVAFLTDKLTEKKIEERFSKNNAETKAQEVRRRSWDATVEEFPDLKDQNSEHYKKTLELVNSDPRYNDIKSFPEGHAVAARMVAVDILRNKLKGQGVKAKEADAIAKKQVSQNSLDVSTGRQTTDTSASDLSKMMDRAMDSKNPYGSEWKEVLRRINSAKSGG